MFGYFYDNAPVICNNVPAQCGLLAGFFFSRKILKSSLLPVGRGTVVVANDWCINASNNIDNLQFFVFFERKKSVFEKFQLVKR